MPKVLNRHHFNGSNYPPNSVYVGRGYNSILGNPFSHLDNTLAKYKVATREEAVTQYEKYMRNILAAEKLLPENKRPYTAAILALAEKNLVCYCAPKSCHGDILIVLCQELVKELQCSG